MNHPDHIVDEQNDQYPLYVPESPHDPRISEPDYEYLLCYTARCCIKEQINHERASKHPRKQSDPIWLDLMPDDVSERIATHLTYGRQISPGLRLARVSAKQNNAVSAVLNHEIRVRSKRELLTWARLFPNHVVELHAHTYTGLWLEKTKVDRMRTFPIRRVCVVAQPSLLTKLQRIVRPDVLTQVVLEIDGFGPDVTRALLAFMNHVRGVNKLVVNWHRLEEPDLSTADTLAFAQQLATACPQLEILHVFTFLINAAMHFPWRMLQLLPQLRQLRVDQPPPPDAIDKLKSLDRLGLLFKDAHVVAHELCTSVTEVAAVVLSGQDLSKLSCCNRLNTLNLVLDEGVEETLLQVVAACSGLRTMSLDWCPTRQEFGEGHYILRYAEAVPRILLRCMWLLPELRSLSLHHVEILTLEVKLILRVIGSRLQHFAVAMLGQADDPLERLKALMETVCEYNTELRSWSFSIGERSPAFLSRSCFKPVVMVRSVGEITRERQRCAVLAFLPFLRQRVPSLSTLSLEMFIMTAHLPDAFALM